MSSVEFSFKFQVSGFKFQSFNLAYAGLKLLRD